MAFLVLLPPSETKRPGGRERPVRWDALALASLAPVRERVVAALEELSADEDIAARALKLGASQRGEIALNRGIRSAPTLPAMDRYTGVLYDALGADTLDAPARRWLGSHVLIHSAPFGPVAASDAIPNYRMAATAALPGTTLRGEWADAVPAAIALASPSFVLDLRSEAYAALGPLSGVPHAGVRVVTGEGRALNHFNKAAKGRLVRDLSTSRPRLSTGASLRRWADAAGWTIRDGGSETWELVV